MTHSPILTVDDLPWCELQAAVLDGELYAIGVDFCSVDRLDDALVRAETIARHWSTRVIAERRSAAWVLGALDVAPARHELCTDAGARTKHPLLASVVLREVVLDADDVVQVGRLGVTSVTRTLVDLVRVEPHFGALERNICRRLLERTSRDACEELMERRRNLPDKARARRRMREL